MKRPLFAAAMCFAAAMAAFVHFGAAVCTAAVFLLAAAAAVSLKRGGAFSLLLAAALAAAVFAGLLLQREAALTRRFAGKQAVCTLQLCRAQDGLFTAEVLCADDAAVRGLYVSFRADEPLYEGERLQADVHFSAADTAVRRAGFTLRGSVEDIRVLRERSQPRYAAAALRRRFGAALGALISGDAGAVCISAVTGDTAVLPLQLKADIRRAGLSDMLAVSGMHVSLLLGTVQLALGERRRLRLFLSALLGVLLCIFYSGSASVVRAVIMQLVALAGSCIDRKSDPLTSLGFAVAVLCALRPYVVFELGFLMSVSCCLGIFLLAQPLLQRMGRETQTHRAGLLRSAFLQQIVLSLCVGLSLLPCYLAAGLSVSFTAPAAAALTSFAMLPQLILSLLAGVLQMLWPFCFLAQLAALGAALLSKWIIFVAQRFSALPLAGVAVSAPPMKAAAAACILVLLLLLLRRLGKGSAVLLCTGLLLAGALTQQRLAHSRAAVWCFEGGAAVVDSGSCALLVQQESEQALFYLWQDMTDYCLPPPDYVIISEDAAAHAAVYFPHAVPVVLSPHTGMLAVGEAGVYVDERRLRIGQAELSLAPHALPAEDTVIYLLPSGSWKAVKL